MNAGPRALPPARPSPARRHLPEAHLQLFVARLNEARDQVMKDGRKETVVWAIELDAAGASARQGITVNSLRRGTIVSVGLHPLRTGLPAGARGRYGLIRCPADAPLAPEWHCDSVKGSTAFGEGPLPAPTGTLPLPKPQ